MESAASLPVLFGMERSVYTRIARLAFEEKGQPYVLQEVEIFGPDGVPAEHFERHPFGRIPALRHGDFALFETSAIARYIDEEFAGPSLQPGDPRRRARMNQVIGIVDAYAYRSMVWGVFVERVLYPLSGRSPQETKIASSLQTAQVCLTAFTTIMDSAPFLAGEAVSLADLHAYPILRYFALAPEGQGMLERFPAVSEWLASMARRRSVELTVAQYEA